MRNWSSRRPREYFLSIGRNRPRRVSDRVAGLGSKCNTEEVVQVVVEVFHFRSEPREFVQFTLRVAVELGEALPVRVGRG